MAKWPIPGFKDGKKVMERYRTALEMHQGGSEAEEIAFSTGFEVEQVEWWIKKHWTALTDQTITKHAIDQIKLSSDRIVKITNNTLAIVESEISKLLDVVEQEDGRVVAIKDMSQLVKTAQTLHAMIETKQQQDQEYDRQATAIKKANNLDDDATFIEMLKQVDKDADVGEVIEAASARREGTEG